MTQVANSITIFSIYSDYTAFWHEVALVLFPAVRLIFVWQGTMDVMWKFSKCSILWVFNDYCGSNTYFELSTILKSTPLQTGHLSYFFLALKVSLHPQLTHSKIEFRLDTIFILLTSNLKTGTEPSLERTWQELGPAEDLLAGYYQNR